MSKLEFYGSQFFFDEMTSNYLYNQLLGGKLISDYWQKENDPNYFQNILFQKGKNKYPSYIKPIDAKMQLYNYCARPHVKHLDDIMQTPEIDSYLGFFISKKVKLLFEKFNLPSTIYYSTKVFFKGNEYPYFFAAISRENNGVIYDKSEFIEYPDIVKAIKKIEDVLLYDKPTITLNFDIIPKKILFSHQIDVFPVISTGGSNFYFSKRLMSAINEEGITGVKFYAENQIEFCLADQ